MYKFQGKKKCRKKSLKKKKSTLLIENNTEVNTHVLKTLMLE